MFPSGMIQRIHMLTMKSNLSTKLLKLTKFIPHLSVLEIYDNRILFTKHGSHLNGSGMRFRYNQLVLNLYSALRVDTVHCIILDWLNNQLPVNFSSSVSCSSLISISDSQEVTENGAYKRIRKMPVMRKDDFYGEVKFQGCSEYTNR